MYNILYDDIHILFLTVQRQQIYLPTCNSIAVKRNGVAAWLS